MSIEDKATEAAKYIKLFTTATTVGDGPMLDEQKKLLNDYYHPKAKLGEMDRHYLKHLVSGLATMDPNSPRAITLLCQARTKGEAILVEQVKHYLKEEFIIEGNVVTNKGLTFSFKTRQGPVVVAFGQDLQPLRFDYKNTKFTFPNDGLGLSVPYIPRGSLESSLGRCVADLNGKDLGTDIKVLGISGSHADVTIGEGANLKRQWIIESKRFSVVGNAVPDKISTEAETHQKALFDLYAESSRLRKEAMKAAPLLFRECEGLAPKIPLAGAPADLTPVGPCYTTGILKGRTGIDATTHKLLEAIDVNNAKQGELELRLAKLGALADYEGRVVLESTGDPKKRLVASSNGLMVTTVEMEDGKPGKVTFIPVPGQNLVQATPADITRMKLSDATVTIRALGLQRDIIEVANDPKQTSAVRAKAAVVVSNLMFEAPFHSFRMAIKDSDRIAADLGVLLAKEPNEDVALALGFSGKSAEPVVATLMKSPDPKVRSFAMYAVSISGAATGREEARELLRAGTKDSDLYVAFKAANSLRIAGAPMEPGPVVRYLENLASRRELMNDVDAMSLIFGLNFQDFAKVEMIYVHLLKTIPADFRQMVLTNLATNAGAPGKVFLMKWALANSPADFAAFQDQQSSLLAIGDSLEHQSKEVVAEMMNFRTKMYLSKDYYRMQVAEECLNRLIAVKPELHAEAVQVARVDGAPKALSDATKRLEEIRTKAEISSPSRLLLTEGILERMAKLDACTDERSTCS